MNAQHALLGLLNEAPNYGYELKKLYDRLFGGEKGILPGQVYSTLSRLERDQKITEIPSTEESGGPERIKYGITSNGKKELQQWLMTPEHPAPQLQATLYMKTVLALLTSGDAAPYLHAQRTAHIQRMRELTRERRKVPLPEMLMIDHALFHIEADLRWIEMTSSRLTKLKEEICL